MRKAQVLEGSNFWKHSKQRPLTPFEGKEILKFSTLGGEGRLVNMDNNSMLERGPPVQHYIQGNSQLKIWKKKFPKKKGNINYFNLH
jgi:hypothetical protein